MNNKKSRAFQDKIIILPFLLFIFFSCDREKISLSIDHIPEKDTIDLVDTVYNVSGSTKGDYRISTNSPSFSPLGSYEDSIFGTSSAGFMTQISPPLQVLPLTQVSLDSVVLQLRSTNHTGNLFQSQIIRIYRLNEPLYDTVAYPETYDPQKELIISKICTFSEIYNDSLLTINLGQQKGIDIARNLLNFNPEANKIDNPSTYFTEKYFKGLYVTPEPVSKGGGMISCDLSSESSGLIIYTEGGNTFKFRIYKDRNTWANVYDNHLPEEQIQQKDKIYLKHLAGSQGQISLSSLRQLRKQLQGKKAVVHHASLIFKPTQTSYNRIREVQFPEKLLLLQNAAQVKIIPDLYRRHYDGSYHSNDSAYVCNITEYTYNYLNKNDTSDLLVRQFNYNTSIKRVILSASDIKLRLEYQEF